MADPDPSQPAAASTPLQEGATSLSPPLSPGLSRQIGRYHIRRLIGSGGMGEVYEAMQEQPRRIVALKVMRPGVASASALRRFEYESQVLARLQHPGIAQIFEAGTHHDPRYPDPIPFFAMEYIAMATPITDFATERRLSHADRLALMSRVCDAVAHGHAKGVIHRDLKPSNILVDADGNPKIIDFGIARGTDSDMATQQTGAGQIIGTLQYMSPEQCSDDPRTLDHRSDIYSLGIILFELLCGRLPYDVGRRPLSEATRIIRDTATPLPSSFTREVRGDAETIILRAIDKNRERRYQSAAALKEDLDRCIAGEPILARRDSPLYVASARVRGLLTRHRSLAAAMAVIVSAVFAMTMGSTFLSHWTAPNRAFEILCDRISVSPITKFEKVRLIALTDSTDIAALAAAERLEGVDPANVKSFRRLHGRLLEHLARAQPGVVMFDIKFREPTPFDEDMAAGARALSAAGTDTVVATPGWEVDAEGSPRLSPALAPVVRWGSASSFVSGTQVWRLQLAVQPSIGETMMSVTLRTLTCLRHPGTDASAAIDSGLTAVRVQPFSPNPQLPGVRAAKGEPMTLPVIALPLVADVPEHGLHRADLVARSQVDPPPDAVFADATWDYGKAMTESPAALRSWCNGKAVIVYDARGDIDRHDHPSGRRMPGAFAHATGLEQLIRLGSIQLPSQAATWIITILAAALCLPFAAHGQGGRTLVAVGILLVAITVASLITYRTAHVLASPLIPCLALVLCAGIVVALPRPRTRRV